MSRFRHLLDRLAPLFDRGGRLGYLHGLFDAVDSFFYSAPDATRTAPHIRDALNLKRVMATVIVALLPALLVGIWNIGLQANVVLSGGSVTPANDWRYALPGLLGAGQDPASLYDCFVRGFVQFIPVFLVSIVAAGFWESLFAGLRQKDANEGTLVMVLIYVMILPPTIPLWQAALGMSFGVVFGKEIFGGTGKNFVNPALLGRAFLYFAYPADASGDEIWIAVDGYSGATALATAAADGVGGVMTGGLSWMQAFLGTLPGSIGETSAAACVFGAFWMIYAGVASWRVMLGCVAGLVLPALACAGIDNGNPMFAVPWYWHLVLGGFAFGAVFMATDPVSSPDTLAGKWLFGLLIGLMTWVIRVLNPGYPEGVMLAILFGNIFAPIIDWFVINANIRRRKRRSA